MRKTTSCGLASMAIGTLITGHARRRRRVHAAAGLLGRAMVAALIAGIPAIGIAAQQVGVFYPDIPGELLLENEYVVVQRYIIEPGQWEGIHSHAGNEVYVHIKGGNWAGRLGGREVYRQTEPSRRMAPSDGWTPSTCPKGTIPATSGTQRWSLSM